MTIVFGLSNTTSEWHFSASSPSKTMEASQLDEVIPLLKTADAEAREGNYVALMLTYEAAPAFDSALRTHESSSLPLAWASVFRTPSQPPTRTSSSYSVTEWMPQIARSGYNSAITSIHELIARGDTYQVNYSFPLTANFKGDAFAWYCDLHAAQGAQYSAYFDLGRYKILSLSPELFFERRGDRVLAKPMKGTVRRGRWPAEDNELAAWLAKSAKDQAENVMIVDLLRNDLGKVSDVGSVEVDSLFQLERFETVWQMTSTVESRLQPETSLVELMRALFPCGSITGAPKIRTMEIIRDLERHPRGIYTGMIGLIRPGGDCIFNVAIRTVVIDSQTGLATFGVGGGVTIDSTADREYEECLVKAGFLDAKPRLFELFESILLEDGNYFLLQRHLERLRNSAQFFGFEFPESRIVSAIDTLRSEHREGRWKAKLTLAKDGKVSTRASEIEEQVKKHLRVGVASSRVDSADRLLFHKTTHRDFYSAELASRSDCDDLVFLNERGEVTESTIANVVVELDGKLLTPPVTAGLLAGTFRDQLIDDGEIQERIITVEELRNVSEFFLINSVRKWMKAVWA